MPGEDSHAAEYSAAWNQYAKELEASGGIGADEMFFGPATETRAVSVIEQIELVLRDHGKELIENHPGTGGVALSLRYEEGRIRPDQPCLTFFVEDYGAGKIPPAIYGVPTDTVEMGRSSLQCAHTPGFPMSPAQPGCSISHVRQKPGTLGCLVRDEAGVSYILSCAHVLSDVYPGTRGDPIIHPAGAYGGAMPAAHVADFEREIPLATGASIADAAIAKVANAGIGVSDIIRCVGTKPTGTATLRGVGWAVKKSGDSTGLTHGVVIGLKGLVGPLTVNGVAGIFFHDVIITDGMSEGGDSGSILLSNSNEALGLLFGGQRHPTTGVIRASWYSPIDTVLSHLKVKLA